MKPKFKILKNGLKVVVAHTPYLNKSSITLLLDGGSVYENNNNRGIFHLCEHAIFLGSKKYPSSMEIENQIRKNSIFYYATTKQEVIEFGMQFHKSNFKKSIELLYELIANPIFDSESIEEEKKRITEEYSESGNNNYQMFSSWVDDFMFRPMNINNDPIGKIKRLTKKDLVSHHKKFYVPNNMIISYVGPESPKKVFALIKETFGTLKKGREIIYPKLKLDFKNKLGKRKRTTKGPKGFKYFTIVLPVKYTKINNEDVVFLFKRILDNKIKDSLVIGKQIAYGVDVYLTDFYKMAVLEISSSFSKKPNKIIRRIEEVFKHFEVTEEELNGIRKTIFQQMDYTKDNTKAYAEYLAYSFFEKSQRDLAGEKRDLKKITAKQINNFAKRILKKENYSIFIADN